MGAPGTAYLIAMLPGNRLLRRLDSFDTDALVNAFGVDQPPPSACDLNDACAVLRELHRKQASLLCQCNSQAASSARLAIVPVGQAYQLHNTGARHAGDCTFSKIPGRNGMRIVTAQPEPARQPSPLALAVVAGDQVSYLRHNLIALISYPASQCVAT